MLTINIYVKLALIALFLIGGVAMTFWLGIGYSWIFLLAGLILLASYLLLGTIQSTADKIQKMDFAGAEKQLSLTYFPNLLYVTNRAMYYILKGSLDANKKDTKSAEENFQKALALKLPTDNEKGMVLLQLCNIQMMKSNWAGAQNYFSQIKKLKITEPMMLEQVDQIKKAIDNRGTMNVARSMGKQGMQMMRNMGGGSKRRRPTMR
jgi:tetratricopeptide (TPR) repeat protein